MRRLPRALGTVALLASASMVGDADAAPITGPTDIGDVTVIVPTEAGPVTGPLADYRPVPGLSGAIRSSAGANLTIGVSAEMVGPADAWLRARVDGRALPTEPMFVAPSQANDDVRAFTFVATGLAAGQHLVEIDWKPAVVGAAPRMRDRTLTMQSAGSARGSISVADSGSSRAYDVATSQYESVPGTAVSVTTSQRGPLAITFSGDVAVASGRLFAQAIVDGVKVSDVLLAEGAKAQRGARSYTLVAPGVAPGAHKIGISARVEGGAAQIHARSIAVRSAPSSTAEGGMTAIGVESAPSTITSTAFVDVPSLSTDVTTSAGASTLVVEAGAQLYVTGGRVRLRALVDGAPARPGDVTFAQAEPKYRASSFAFALDNVTPGRHTIRVQAAVDAGATAGIADRFVRVAHARRSGAAFVRPYMAMRPRTRTFQTVVICFDPMRPGHTPPSKRQLADMFEGDRGGASLRGWWSEVSAERVVAGSVKYLGCEDGAWYRAPKERQGTYYWDKGAFEQMWKDALTAADPALDFHAYDTDRDGRISPDELVVAIVRPQSTPYGTTRSASVSLDGIGKPIDVHVSDLYLSPTPSHRTWNVGLIAHELSHSLIDAADLYSPCPAETDAKNFSIMNRHESGTHLDPFHKLKSGFATADALNIATWKTKTVSLRAVEGGDHEVLVLYDPAKSDKEYFVIENRVGGKGKSATYDEPLGDNVVVWHVIEDEATRNAYPTKVSGAGAVCRVPVRFVKNLGARGASQDLVWADGTPAKIRVKLASSPSVTASVEIAKTR